MKKPETNQKPPPSRGSKPPIGGAAKKPDSRFNKPPTKDDKNTSSNKPTSSKKDDKKDEKDDKIVEEEKEERRFDPSGHDKDLVDVLGRGLDLEHNMVMATDFLFVIIQKGTSFRKIPTFTGMISPIWPKQSVCWKRLSCYLCGCQISSR